MRLVFIIFFFPVEVNESLSQVYDAPGWCQVPIDAWVKMAGIIVINHKEISNVHGF
jgi:hypothetical protein